MSYTTDPNHPDLVRRDDDAPRKQAETYLVLSEEERAKGFIRPVRRSYKHTICGTVTTMGMAIAETYARDPQFYTGTYCCGCQMHRPLSEFTWEPDGSLVGS
ncbi:hypothetical protein [Thalassobaculum litoreum]|uniref:Uncharacterized protein n=1 Tax=Thalassobaculum litoreum DSM 18839 TaxID=1123362 RepID=A0A8G2EYI7_9PROT|nr:hypothetical protein [Thalassobaculum litoreum]SDF84441.1 hypothetical protein SAMN05660686_02511 [Thalassobaculum litoreum DSM 18839]